MVGGPKDRLADAADLNPTPAGLHLMPTADRTARSAPVPAEPDEIRDLRAVLRQHGLRCTSQRLAVVALLTGRPDSHHLTATQLHRRLSADGHQVDVSTVYRTLELLVELGTVHATAHADGATSYGSAAVPHHHAVCRRCGRIGEVPAEALRLALGRAARASDYQLSDDSLLLPGLCAACVADEE